jgi:hypothetical protein
MEQPRFVEKFEVNVGEGRMEKYAQNSAKMLNFFPLLHTANSPLPEVVPYYQPTFPRMMSGHCKPPPPSFHRFFFSLFLQSVKV